MHKIKFSAFADLHYYPGVFRTDALARLRKISERATREQVDFVIHLGDLCHGPTIAQQILDAYNALPHDTYHVLGNHEFEHSTWEEVLHAYGLEKGYYFFDRNGFRFIVLNPNCMQIDGKEVPYSMGNFFHCPPQGNKITLGKVQNEWLRDTVMESPYPCVLLSHQSLERYHAGFSYEEYTALHDFLESANRDKHRIVMALNGHHHTDYLRILHGIAFLDMNSASYYWLDTAHTLYPAEWSKESRLVGNTLLYEDPVHAVITLREDGSFQIDGMKSRFVLDIDCMAIGQSPMNIGGRLITPHVHSAQGKIR